MQNLQKEAKRIRRLVIETIGNSGADEAFFSKYGMNVENIVDSTKDL